VKWIKISFPPEKNKARDGDPVAPFTLCRNKSAPECSANYSISMVLQKPHYNGNGLQSRILSVTTYVGINKLDQSNHNYFSKLTFVKE
jgi:hypothetical protein